MKRWKIESEAGFYLGTYSGETVEDALDALAREAGYDDANHARGVAGPFKGTVTEIEAQ